MDFSNSDEWIEAFEAVDAFNPTHFVSGQGPTTNMTVARADTFAYLTN